MRTMAVPTLVPGQHIVVRNVHVGTLPATVERSDGSTVTVALAVKDERITRLVGHELAVEAISGRGIHRFGGVLSAQAAGSLTIALSGDVERIQRREYVRIAAHLEVSVKGIDESIGGETSTLDVSGSGIQIADKWRLPLGLDVRVELQIPGGEPVRALGRVVRAAAEDEKGISIEDLPRADEDRLIRFIRERERQAMRAARAA
jgi:hypothetical protein